MDWIYDNLIELISDYTSEIRRSSTELVDSVQKSISLFRL